MSSTFGTLNTAFTGITAARQGMGVTAQNMTNAGTAGYTRQRLETSAASPVAQTGLITKNAPTAGQGVNVDSISRLGNQYLDARVRAASAESGYAGSRAEALSALETTLREPGEHGISARLQSFWAGWQDLANQAGETAPTGALLESGAELASSISASYRETADLWGTTRARLDGMAAELNQASAQVAELNAEIRSTLNQGGAANELTDQRNLLTERISALAGGVVRGNTDGTVDVYIGGNAIVSGDTARSVQISGAIRLEGSTGVHLEFTHRPGSAVALDGGSIAGTLSVLAPADGNGTGGAIAEAAASYNSFATSLATQVNAVHAAGTSPDGSTGLQFFGFAAGVPAAQGLLVIPAAADGVATGSPGGGAYDGSNADKISQLPHDTNSPDKLWAAFVTSTGVAAKSNLQHSAMADMSLASAGAMQMAGASVSLDEENVNLLAYQHAYQAAARVMTAVDEMLDTLINRTGLVGR